MKDISMATNSLIKKELREINTKLEQVKYQAQGLTRELIRTNNNESLKKLTGVISMLTDCEEIIAKLRIANGDSTHD